MGQVIQFKQKKPSEKHKGNTLCRSGFHKWKIVTEKQFDVKQGRLMTIFQCTRCQIMKNKYV